MTENLVKKADPLPKCDLPSKKRTRKPVDPNMIDTGWSIDLDYGPPDNPNRSGFLTSKDTLEEAIQDMIKYAMYYMGWGYIVTVKKIERYCKKCSGQGSWRIKMMSPKRKTCPACHGAGNFGSIIRPEGFKVLLSEASTILNDAK